MIITSTEITFHSETVDLGGSLCLHNRISIQCQPASYIQQQYGHVIHIHC